MNDNEPILTELRKISARAHYAEAFRLFPSDENGESLAAVDRRIQAEKLRPGATTNANRLPPASANPP